MSDEEQVESLADRLDDLAERAERIEKMVTAIHNELEAFRPMLRLFKPGSGVSDVARAGAIRQIRGRLRRGGDDCIGC